MARGAALKRRGTRLIGRLPVEKKPPKATPPLESSFLRYIRAAAEAAPFYTADEVKAAVTQEQFAAAGLVSRQASKATADAGPVAPPLPSPTLKPSLSLEERILQHLLDRGLSATRLQLSGFNAQELYDLLKLNKSQLEKLGFNPHEELKPEANLSPAELSARRQAFANKVQNTQILNVRQLQRLGFTATELKNAGFSLRQLVKAGFNASALRNAGFDPTSLIKQGFSFPALRAAGFTARDVINSLNSALPATLRALVGAGPSSSYQSNLEHQQASDKQSPKPVAADLEAPPEAQIAEAKAEDPNSDLYDPARFSSDDPTSLEDEPTPPEEENLTVVEEPHSSGGK